MMEPLGIGRPKVVLVCTDGEGPVHWFKFLGDGMPACEATGITLPVNPLAVEGLTLACQRCQAEFDKLYHPDTAASR